MTNESESGARKRGIQIEPRKTLHRLRNRTLPVLSALALLLVFYPAFDRPGEPTPLIAMVLFSIVPLFGVFMLAPKRWMIVAAFVALALNIASICLHGGHTEQAIANWPGILVLSFYVVATAIMAYAVFLAPSVVDDRIYGGVAVYLMIAVIFAILHHRIYVEDRTSYIFGVDNLNRGEMNWADFLYYSFVSLTTIGFGDIVPKSAWARNASVFEAAIGMLYPAVLLARLVNRTDSDRAARQRPSAG